MPKIVDEEGHALKAILLLVLGMSFIPLNDALIKVMSERLPLAEIVAMRAVMSLGILIIFTKGIRSVSMLDLKTIILFIIRSQNNYI
jgi:hydrogenase/urease accessory protein HupE